VEICISKCANPRHASRAPDCSPHKRSAVVATSRYSQGFRQPAPHGGGWATSCASVAQLSHGIVDPGSSLRFFESVRFVAHKALWHEQPRAAGNAGVVTSVDHADVLPLHLSPGRVEAGEWIAETDDAVAASVDRAATGRREQGLSRPRSGYDDLDDHSRGQPSAG
jgi:hypothetical protein